MARGGARTEVGSITLLAVALPRRAAGLGAAGAPLAHAA
jgi:hypothetical protein